MQCTSKLNSHANDVNWHCRLVCCFYKSVYMSIWCDLAGGSCVRRSSVSMNTASVPDASTDGLEDGYGTLLVRCVAPPDVSSQRRRSTRSWIDSQPSVRTCARRRAPRACGSVSTARWAPTSIAFQTRRAVKPSPPTTTSSDCRHAWCCTTEISTSSRLCFFDDTTLETAWT